MKCPLCDEEIVSGIGFRLGAIENRRYKVGDELSWDGDHCRPDKRPQISVIRTIGYFNCDNIRCPSWQDCFPEVQSALIVVTDNKIASAEPYEGETEEEFQILEPTSQP